MINYTKKILLKQAVSEKSHEVYMEIIQEKGCVRIHGVSDFSLQKTFECGQCFRWKKDGHTAYVGVAYSRAARVWEDGGDVLISGSTSDFEDVWRSYFDLDRDYRSIRCTLSKDLRLKDACDFGAGIRILRQEPWEALASFILSQCNNIPRIQGIIDRFCTLFGDAVPFEGQALHAFPAAERVAALSESDLAPLRCGYRAPYLLSAARAVTSGQIDFNQIASADIKTARRTLMGITGVGAKVADCVLLYGLYRLDAFPVDVWIKRASELYLGNGFDPCDIRENAGIAQQYLFHYVRNGGKTAV